MSGSVSPDDAAAGNDLCLFLLGGFHAEAGGHPVPDQRWQRPRARALVKLLATVPGHRLHREQILETLWPHLTPEAALVSFRRALSLARHALEPALAARGASSFLRLSGEVLALGATVWIDADHFEALAQAALQGSAGRMPAQARADYEAALAAYSGELLPEDRYADWTTARREALAACHRQLLLGLASLLEHERAYAAAAERLQQVLQQDPTQEDVHRRLMRLYALAGSRQQALRQYQRCGQLLRAEAGREPEPATQRLYQEILADRLLPAAPASSPVPPVGKLPTREPPALPAVLQQAPATPFVGRERLLELLLAEAARSWGWSQPAPAGREPLPAPAQPPAASRIVLVSGEAGVGKSRLCAEVAHRVQRQGVLVLWGASYEQEGRLPYGPFIEAFADSLASCSRAEQQRLLRAYPELGPLLSRGLAGPTHAGFPLPNAPALESAQSPESARARLFAAIVGLLSELATAQPLLLVLDDLHAADATSLEVLHHLVRLLAAQRGPARPGPPRLHLVGTYREEDVERGSVFQRLLASLDYERLCRHVELLRLARPDCDRLVQAALPGAPIEPALLERIYTQSLGNPLFALQLLHDLQERQALMQVKGRWLAPTARTVAVPQEVQRLVTVRVDRLGAAVRQLLDLAAVAGMEWSFALLRQAARLAFHPPPGEAALVEALERALEARVVEERADGYAFRHPLLRAALYEGISHERRRWLHAALAQALREQASEEVEALAFHYQQAQQEEQARVYLERAGDLARALYANEVAESHYRDLLAQLERLGDAQAAARVREKLASVLLTLGRFDEALSALEAARETYQQAGELEQVGRLTVQIGSTHRARGTVQQGVACIQAVLTSYEPRLSVRTRAALSLAQATLLFAGGRYRQMLAAADQAIAALHEAEAETFPEAAQMRAAGEVARANALLHLEEWPAARAVVARALPVVQAAGNLNSLRVGELVLAFGHLFGGELRQSRAQLERTLQLVERMGDLTWIAFVKACLGYADFIAGEWEQARGWLEQAVGTGHAVGASWHTAYPPLYLGWLLFAEGKWEEAEPYLEEARALASRSQNLELLPLAQGVLAERELLEGRVEAARARLAPLVCEEGLSITLMLPQLAWALLEAGETAQANELVEQAIGRASRQGYRLPLVEARRVQALLLGRQARGPEALAAAQEAGDLARAIPYPYGEARALATRGGLAAHLGQPETARRSWEEALAIFQHLGAARDAERAAQALSALAHRS